MSPALDSVNTDMGKGEGMKPFKGKLSRAEMASIGQYVKELATRSRTGGE